MDGVKEVRVEAVPYCCSTCDGGEVACRNLARRGRKTRSLSTSSASSSSEYRSVHGIEDHKWGYRLWKKLCVSLFTRLQAVLTVSSLWNADDVRGLFRLCK